MRMAEFASTDPFDGDSNLFRVGILIVHEGDYTLPENKHCALITCVVLVVHFRVN
jgi:hypothetical protein